MRIGDLSRHLSREDGPLDTQCMIWHGRLNRDGYGVYSIGYHGDVLVHRHLWQQIRGSLGEGIELDHLCRVRACCNVNHLEVVSHGENMERQKAARTHCKRNHEFTEENTRIYKGRRVCRACDKERKHE